MIFDQGRKEGRIYFSCTWAVALILNDVWMWPEREREGGEGDDETDLMVSTTPTHPLFSKVKSESFVSKEEWQGAPDTPPPPIIIHSSCACLPDCDSGVSACLSEEGFGEGWWFGGIREENWEYLLWKRKWEKEKKRKENGNHFQDVGYYNLYIYTQLHVYIPTCSHIIVVKWVDVFK